MRKLIVFALVLFSSIKLTAQTDGMSYQAVILNPKSQEIPGVNAAGNVFPNKALSVRFTITNSNNVVEYQEVHATSTDAYGMINLVIGKGFPSLGVYTGILWDGTSKDLKVEINLDGSYKDLSNQALLFTPYALHRDITATGKLSVRGDVAFSGNLVVDGTTNLNKSLSVNNGSSTKLTGALTVDGVTNLNNAFTVANGSPSDLSGLLKVAGATNLNNTLAVSGTTTLNNNLIVAGQKPTGLTGALTVDGVTNLNNSLNVTNGSPVYLSGNLEVAGKQTLNDDLTVNGITTLNKSLTVKNQSSTGLTGILTVDGATTLNNTLSVTGGKSTNLTGTLNVDGATDINSTLTVDGATTLNNTFSVTGGKSTNLTGTLNVDGATDINSTLTVDGATVIDNSLNVTGVATFGSIATEGINIKSANPDFVATFENTDGRTGDGLLIKLGRTHGAWNGGSYLNIENPALVVLDGPLNTVKGWLDGGSFSPADLLNLVPVTYLAGGIAQITNAIIGSINTGLGLPRGLPEVAIPQFTIVNEIVFFNGGRWCLPQACEEICDPTGLLGCATVCVPPFEICTPSIPRIASPAIVFPRTTLLPAIPNLIPRIPTIPTNGLPQLTIPNFTFSEVSNSLSKENEYITFQDKDGRQTGTIRAQSTKDFRDNTVLDNVYVLNVIASFVGVDLLDGITSGIVNISNLVDSFNKIGVEYSSGHGDYAEWLERLNQEEYITAGDIVAVKGGKITRDLTNVEQIMVVSHKPIVLGNIPENGKNHIGNNVAFMGQVPVKVMGAVKSGDFIVASKQVKGYGVAIHPEDMKSQDHLLAVGRTWENKPNLGPKMVNTVVGVQNGNWKVSVEKVKQQQLTLDQKILELELKLNAVDKKIKTKKLNETNYASKN
jgi:hypothetical protein